MHIRYMYICIIWLYNLGPGVQRPNGRVRLAKSSSSRQLQRYALQALHQAAASDDWSIGELDPRWDGSPQALIFPI